MQPLLPSGSHLGSTVHDFRFAGDSLRTKAKLPKNEHRNRRAKLRQLLTVDTGIPHLDRQLTADLTLMQIAETKQPFEEN